jgi:hypothetical protein
METYILTPGLIPLRVHEMPINPHLIDLLQTQRIVPQVRLTEAPPVRHYEALQLRPDLREAIVDGLERRADVLALLLRFDLLDDVEAFFQQGGADGLRGGDEPAGTEELAVDTLPVVSCPVTQNLGGATW